MLGVTTDKSLVKKEQHFCMLLQPTQTHNPANNSHYSDGWFSYQ